MICSNCGAHIHEKDLSCKFCGYTNENIKKDKIDTGEQATETHQEPTLKELIEKNLYDSAQQRKEIPIPDVYSESKQQSRQIPPKKEFLTPNQKPLPIILSLIITLLLISSAATYYLVNNSGDNGSLQFNRAEELFENKNYQQALMAYGKFLREFPESHLTDSARKKTSKINRIVKQMEEENKRLLAVITPLMAKAEQAYQAKKLLVPPKDNAHLYLTEIFVLDPNYNPARKMQQEIIDYYSEQAIVALESKRYALAVRNYENILKFTPGAPEIIEKLDNTLTLRDEEFAKYQLLIEQKKDSLESPMLASIDSISFNSLDIRQLVQDDSEPIGLENVQTAETQNQPAVNSGYSIPLEGTLTQKEPIIEALIDGGTRQYLHREKPVIPSWLRYDGIHKIRVECIVNTKGRVEMVSLMKPSTNKALNKLAINTFKRYKYKPATLRGIPVRFKVVEIIIFR